MENNQLSQAIAVRDIDKINLLLATGDFSVNGNGLRGEPLIIECVRALCRKDDDEDDTKSCAILELLVQHGADVNVYSKIQPCGVTAAMVAAQRGYYWCLQFLVESNADLSIVSHNGNTALTLSAREGHEDCVKYLIKHASHSILKHKDKFGRTALMIAASYKGRGYYHCVQCLIEAGAELDEVDKDGDTALMLALQCYSFKVVALLLQHGACVNTVSHSGETPLKLALQSKSGEAVTSLLEKGACVNDVSNSGETPLTVASNIGHSLKLLRHGLDPTLSRRDRDCLHVMVKLGQKSMVRGLVLNGFPPFELDLRKLDKYMYGLSDLRKPRSPLALAIVSSSPDIAKYLVLNHFFTPRDISQLCRDKEISLLLKGKINPRDSYSSARAKESLEIMRYMSTNLQSLRHLCLITITSTLSQDLCLDLPDSIQGKNRWKCKPTFREKVELLKIPPSLQRALLHQTVSAAICCYSWGNINLWEKCDFPPCNCKICEENDYNP